MCHRNEQMNKVQGTTCVGAEAPHGPCHPVWPGQLREGGYVYLKVLLPLTVIACGCGDKEWSNRLIHKNHQSECCTKCHHPKAQQGSLLVTSLQY